MLAGEQARSERRFRFDSEHFLSASSLWHLLLTREADQYRLRGAPSAQPLWRTRQAQQLSAERASWWLVGASFVGVCWLLARAQSEVLSQPEALIMPLLLLSAPEWLGRALSSMPACNRYIYSRNTLRQLQLIDCPPIAAPGLRHSLELEQFAPRDYPSQPLSVTLPAQGTVLLSGSSGSGKSGLLQALAGHIPARGTRRVDGEALPAGLVQQWAYCEQTPIILQGTLRANLVLGEEAIPDAQLLHILARLGLDDLTDLDEWLGVGGRQLSGGEKNAWPWPACFCPTRWYGCWMSLSRRSMKSRNSGWFCS